MNPELQNKKQPTEEKTKESISNDIAEMITDNTGKETIDICGFGVNLKCTNCKKGMFRTKHNVCVKCQVYKYCIECKKYHEKKHSHPIHCNIHWDELTNKNKIYFRKEANSIKKRSKIKDIASICCCIMIYKKTKKFLPF